MGIAVYLIPLFLAIILIFALKNKINAYEAFTAGAKKGIETALSIFPYLLAMLLATKLLQYSNLLITLFQFLPETLQELSLQGILKPLSGNASLAVLIEIYEKHGVDSNIGLVSSILQGSTDTTFYIVTLYCGSVGINRYRYSLWVGLLANAISFILCLLLFYFIM